MLRKLIIALSAASLACAPAHAQTGSVKTPAVLATETNALWQDNQIGGITPFNARQTLLDIIASSANPSNAFPNASANVEGTGVAGLDGAQWFIYHAPNAPSVTTAPNTLRVDRVPMYTGGTPGNVFNAIWGNCNVSAGVADYEWCGLFQLANHATAGENVALAASASQFSNGPTWATDFIVRDTVSTTASLANIITSEFDLLANGTDVGANRVIQHLVLEKQVGGGAAVHTSKGIWLDGFDGAANDIYDTGILFGVNAAFGTAIDMSGSTVTTAWKSGGNVTITGAGLVGIGAVGGPAVLLDVSGNAAALPATTASARFSAVDGGPPTLLLESFGAANVLQFRRADGTNGSKTGLVANDLIANIVTLGYNSTGAYTTSGATGIQMIATETWSGTANGGAIKLRTTPNTTTTLTDAVTIQNSGGVSVGTATDPGLGKIGVLTAYNVGANQVVGARVTGYTAMTGSPDKATAYATSTVTLAQLAGRVAQLQADLTTHGLIGP